MANEQNEQGTGEGGTGDASNSGTGTGENDGNPPANAGNSGSGNQGKEPDISALVREEVRKALGENTGGNAGNVSAVRRADIEAQAERLVREAASKVKKEDDKDAEIERLKEQVKAIVEKPPKQLRRLTKLIWGSDD